MVPVRRTGAYRHKKALHLSIYLSMVACLILNV